VPRVVQREELHVRQALIICLLMALVVSIPGCRSAPQELRMGEQSITVCFDGLPDGTWLQFAVYDARPLPAYPARGLWQHTAYWLLDSGMDFGQSNHRIHPVYSGLQAVNNQTVIGLAVAEGQYMLLLLGQEIRQPVFWTYPEAELVLLMNLSTREKQSSKVRTFALSKRFLYEATLNPGFYKSARLEVRSRNGTEAEAIEVPGPWGYVMGYSEPSGKHGLRWLPGACNSSGDPFDD
jgi:hypothetical protein